MSRFSPVLVCLGVLVAAAVCPATGSAQIGRTEVVSVRFEGNESFPRDSLARAIVTRETECRSAIFSPFCWAGADFALQEFYLQERQIPLDRLRLQVWYQIRGFREATVDTARTMHEEGTAEVSFLVVEGQPVLVRSISVEGVEGFNDPEITATLPLLPGDRLSQIALEATRDSLQNRLANRGYARVEVFRRFRIPADDPYGAEVTYSVEVGTRAYYGPVEIFGNESLSDATIRNTLEFREGDLYRGAELFESQSRLFGLDIMRSATVQPDFANATDSVIPVRVDVTEGDEYRVRYGAGLSNAECFDLETRWTARNFRGGGRILQARARVSNLLTPQFRDILCPQAGKEEFGELNWLASIDFAQPWIFSTRNSFVASVFGERQSLPDVFVRQAVGLQVALTRAIGPQTSLTISYRPELSRLEAAELLFCTGFLVCTPEDIDILDDVNMIAPIGISFSRNLANNPLNPTRGYSLALDLEHAAGWTGSNFRYDRFLAEAATYNAFGSGVVAARIRGGWVGAGPFSELVRGGDAVDIVQPEKRFYAGGANSVRGFAQSRLGPRVLQVLDPVRLMTVSSTSVTAACTPAQVMDLSCDATPLGDAGFIPRPTGGTRLLEANLDIRFGISSSFEGVVFADVGQVWAVKESAALADLEITPGAGVRYLSPIGPIRVDVAYRLRGGQALSVVTSQIRPFDPSVDNEEAKLSINGVFAPYVRTKNIALLTPTVLFGHSSSWSLRRFQLHISIGQAF